MKATTKSPNGTSFHGVEFTATVRDMKEVLGAPWYESNDGRDKVNMEWVFETENGQVFTIYDWKEYRKLNDTDTINWHIGALSAEDSMDAFFELDKFFSE